MTDIESQREHDGGHHATLLLAGGLLSARGRLHAILERHAPVDAATPIDAKAHGTADTPDGVCLALLGAIAFLEKGARVLEEQAPKVPDAENHRSAQSSVPRNVLR